GFVGTYAGGWIGDYYLRTSRQAYLWVSGIATLVAGPLTLAGLARARPPVYWTAIVAAELLLFASTGPINSAIVNVVPPAIRATAVALSIFTIHILGDVPSPWLVGVLSDARTFGEAVLIIPVAVLRGVPRCGFCGALDSAPARRAGGQGGARRPVAVRAFFRALFGLILRVFF